jgi:hypothetical protein
VPAIPLLFAVWAHFSARSTKDEERGLKAIREQFAADAAMLRSVTES